MKKEISATDYIAKAHEALEMENLPKAINLAEEALEMLHEHQKEAKKIIRVAEKMIADVFVAPKKGHVQSKRTAAKNKRKKK